MIDPAWPFFEARHRDLAARLADWLARTEGETDSLARLGQSGWLGIAIPKGSAPESYDCRALFLLREALARARPESDSEMVAQAMGAAPMVLRGSPAQRARLAAARGGDWRVGLAGPAGEAAPVRAERDGDSFRLSGRIAAPLRGAADSYVVLAAAASQAGQDALSAFLVERDSAGIAEIAPARHGTVALLRLDRCLVPAAGLIGGEGEGLQLAVAVRELFGASAAAAAIGLARAVLDRIAGRAAHRALFGRRLVAYQEVQGRLADLATRIEAAGLLACRAAWARDDEAARMPRESGMARLSAFATAEAAIAEAETMLPDSTGWLDERRQQFEAITSGYDRAVEQLLLAGQTLNLLRPTVDGWSGRARARDRSEGRSA